MNGKVMTVAVALLLAVGGCGTSSTVAAESSTGTATPGEGVSSFPPEDPPTPGQAVLDKAEAEKAGAEALQRFGEASTISVLESRQTTYRESLQATGEDEQSADPRIDPERPVWVVTASGDFQASAPADFEPPTSDRAITVIDGYSGVPISRGLMQPSTGS